MLGVTASVRPEGPAELGMSIAQNLSKSPDHIEVIGLGSWNIVTMVLYERSFGTEIKRLM